MDAHEATQMHQNFSQQLLQDHIAACSFPEHNLISVSTTSISHTVNSESFKPAWIFKDTFVWCVVVQWTDGLPPVQFQPQNGPTTSLASLL